ncbi:MAG: SufD family Fe-S cluster assembly protein [Candidatus Melainabacteria bacterium]|nr:SufD family Fe-S cluster assembly protein [Candidatus Melainabacteria bacterium]
MDDTAMVVSAVMIPTSPDPASTLRQPAPQPDRLDASAHPLLQALLSGFLPVPSLDTATPVPLAQGHPALLQMKEDAAALLARVGLPKKSHEEWRYVNVNALFPTLTEYTTDLEANRPSSDTAEKLEAFVNTHSIAKTPESVYRLVFVNNCFSAPLSVLPEALPGEKPSFQCLPLSLANPTQREQALHFAKQTFSSDHPLGLMNLLSLNEAAWIHLDANATADRPIELMFISTDGPQTLPLQTPLHQPRILIEAKTGAKAAIFTHWISTHPAEDNSLTNAVVDLALAPHAQLTFTQVLKGGPNCRQMVSHQLHLQEHSQLNSFSLCLGAQIQRYEASANLSAPQAICHLSGLTILHGHSEAHQSVSIQHRAANSHSTQTFKTILHEQSRAEFSGQIHVAPNAIQTDARQLSNTLLLSPEAQIYNRPWLRIDADDVSCSHGATVGQLAEDALFYLTSRGLGEEAARCLLTYAFAESMLINLDPLDFKQALEQRVLSALGQSQSPDYCFMSCDRITPSASLCR